MHKKLISNLLWRDGRPLFATVDVARAGDIHAMCIGAPQISPLYADQDAVDMLEVAPYLADVGPDSKVLDRLVTEGWGRSWGVYVTCKCNRPFEAVLSHLRSFIRVRTEDGRMMFFRYYDPRVLRVFLPACNPKDAKQFFGPIDAFWLEDEDPSICLKFQLGARGVVKSVIDARELS